MRTHLTLFAPLYKASTPAIATIPANPAEITPVGTLAPPELEAVGLADDDAAAPLAPALPDVADIARLVVMPAPPVAPPATTMTLPFTVDMVALPVAATVVPLLARVEATVPFMKTVPLRVMVGPRRSVPLLLVPLPAAVMLPVVIGNGAAVMLVGDAVPFGATVTPAWTEAEAAAEAGMR